MTHIINGQMIQTDSKGFLIEPGQWNKDVAFALASYDDIQLSREHWLVIVQLRQYVQQYQSIPSIEALLQQLNQVMGGKHYDERALLRLFPKGIEEQCYRLSGLPALGQVALAI